MVEALTNPASQFTLMIYTAIFVASVALISFSSQAADTPSDSKTSSLSVATNAPHLHPTFTERLRQIREHDATNNASKQALLQFSQSGTNAEHIRLMYAEKLQQIKEQQISNRVEFQKQMQQIQCEHDEALKRAATPMPPLQPLQPGVSLPSYKQPGT